eukprot:TRINITY_DN65642_c7_g4_i1.p1 TRINITY_DN65642_c7_g4~~TRINITY_DN65642_c7_g4_i1.p1  ORF type:complete len:385 (-),score=7.36 TRINITY_DN65642_c7_g4_i1:192-1346(-)
MSTQRAALVLLFWFLLARTTHCGQLYLNPFDGKYCADCKPVEFSEQPDTPSCTQLQTNISIESGDRRRFAALDFAVTFEPYTSTLLLTCGCSSGISGFITQLSSSMTAELSYSDHSPCRLSGASPAQTCRGYDESVKCTAEEGAMQKVLISAVRDCTPGCSAAMQMSYTCNRICNVSACGYNNGACLPSRWNYCSYGGWSAWSACSVQTCTQTRTRPILNVRDPAACDGSLENRFCQDHKCTPHECAPGCGSNWGDGKCDKACATPSCNWDDGDCPQCFVGAWSPWGLCPKCGTNATVSRTRSVTTVGDRGQCTHNTKETKPCTNIKPCPQNCIVSAWSGWYLCNEPCGGGVQHRTRKIVREPTRAGAKCPTSTQARACNIGPC